MTSMHNRRNRRSHGRANHRSTSRFGAAHGGFTGHHGLSDASKVALATAAGAAVGATAAGLVISARGRRITTRVGDGVKHMVDAGRRRLAINRVVRGIVEAGIGSALGAALPDREHLHHVDREALVERIGPGVRSARSRGRRRSHGRGEGMKSERIGGGRVLRKVRARRVRSAMHD
jgi:hypothetical protein